MSYQQDLFLAALSHQWSPLVLLGVILLGLARWRLSVIEQNRVRTRSLAVAGTAVTVLFVGSILVLLVAWIHLGCAGLVAYQSKCRDNMKQLGLALLMYAQDNDDRYPPAAGWSERISSRLMPADRSRDPLKCEEATTPGSYALNQAVAGLKLDKLEAPALTVLAFEADAPNRSFAGGPASLALKRHGGMPNVLFCDGHTQGANSYRQQHLNWTGRAPFTY